MARYKIEYFSENSYDDTVTDAVFEFNVVACQDENQLSLISKKSNSLNEQPFIYDNKYGFEINRIRTNKSFKTFEFSYTAMVDVEENPVPASSLLDSKKEFELISSNEFYIDHHLFIRKTPLTYLIELPLGCPAFIKGMSYFEYLVQLNKWVFEYLNYEKDVTTVKTKAQDLVKLKKGVCQDFVHLFISLCRLQKLPARYVSGYINQGLNFKGDSFMHAWVEAFVPELGWVGFDPTNNLLVDYHFIKVSHGVDYSDCTPIKGVLYTNGPQAMNYKVLVAEQ
ncbi:MAG: transglutaminase family protein [Cytophagales bacterium]